jgi:hypothetical protein
LNVLASYGTNGTQVAIQAGEAATVVEDDVQAESPEADRHVCDARQRRVHRRALGDGEVDARVPMTAGTGAVHGLSTERRAPETLRDPRSMDGLQEAASRCAGDVRACSRRCGAAAQRDDDSGCDERDTPHHAMRR